MLELSLIFAIIFLNVLTIPSLAPAQVTSGPFTVGYRLISDIPVSNDIEFSGEPYHQFCPDDVYYRPVQNKAIIYYPADAGGEYMDLNSVAPEQFLLIVYGHATRGACSECPETPVNNLEDYTRVSEILRHLASWGFIVISADLSWLTSVNGSNMISDRMYALRDAVNYMIAENSRDGSPFKNRIRTTRIGAMGHSNGADAAVMLGTSGVLGDKVQALAAIAPPNHHYHYDNYNIESFAPNPVMILQGTKDELYFFPEPPGAEILYNSARQNKHLITIQNANHFGYTDDICDTSDYFQTDLSALPRDDQQRIAKAYLAAFFRWYLKSECTSQLSQYLDGYLRIPGLEGLGLTVSQQTIPKGCVPDLIIEDITTNPLIYEPGKVEVSVSVKNIGSAAGAFRIDFYNKRLTAPMTRNARYSGCEIQGLAAGETQTCTWSYVSEGTSMIWAQVDTDEAVAEYNELNNIYGPRIICDGQPATIIGTAKGDTIYGTEGNDVIVGLGGDDRIYGLGGDDVICGGEGNDSLSGGDGNDKLYGENGNDTLNGNAGNDIMDGGAEMDTVSFAKSAAGVNANLSRGFAGGEGVDTLVVNTIENIIGSYYDDIIVGDAGGNILTGGRGNDILYGLGGDDVLRGGTGYDICNGGTQSVYDKAVNCEHEADIP